MAGERSDGARAQNSTGGREQYEKALTLSRMLLRRAGGNAIAASAERCGYMVLKRGEKKKEVQRMS